MISEPLQNLRTINFKDIPKNIILLEINFCPFGFQCPTYKLKKKKKNKREVKENKDKKYSLLSKNITASIY